MAPRFNFGKNFAGVEVKMKGQARLFRKLRELPAEVTRAASGPVLTHTKKVHREARSDVPQFLGKLHRSLEIEFHKRRRGTTGQVITDEEYALAVHFGVGQTRTVTKRPPIDPSIEGGLFQWAVAHGVSPEEAKGFAWAIRDDVMDREPNPFLFDAANEDRADFYRDVERELDLVLQRLAPGFVL